MENKRKVQIQQQQPAKQRNIKRDCTISKKTSRMFMCLDSFFLIASHTRNKKRNCKETYVFFLFLISLRKENKEESKYKVRVKTSTVCS